MVQKATTLIFAQSNLCLRKKIMVETKLHINDQIKRH